MGSAAGQLVAQRIADQLSQHGLTTNVIVDTACSRKKATCGRVANVVGYLAPPDPGDRMREGVLVSAHHDSVPAGPGAGDDGAGVATLIELAHQLANDPNRRNPIYFVAVDGEEEGLLGAHALMASKPWPQDLGAPTVAVNLDAGGTRGVTSVTRTTPGNARLINVFARSVARPHGSSVIAAAYGLTPYDTDFSAYEEGGLDTLDLAFGEDKTHYHTPLDRLENLDADSVAHLGDTALSVLTNLAQADLTGFHNAAEVVHVDALGWVYAHIPSYLARVLAGLCLLVWVAAAGRLCRRQHGVQAIFLRALACWPLWIAGCTAVAAGLCAAAAWLVEQPTPAGASPLVLRAAMWGLTTVATAFVGVRLARKLDGEPAKLQTPASEILWWAGWLWLATITAVLGLFAPAACIATLPPVAIGAGAAMICSRTTSRVVTLVAMAAANLVAAVVLIQGALRMEWIFGLKTQTAAIVLAPLCILIGLQLPMWRNFHVRTRKFIGRPMTGLACLAYLTCLGLPASSAAHPRRLNIVVHQDHPTEDAPNTRVMLAADRGHVPQAIKELAEFSPEPERMYPWLREQEQAWIAPLSGLLLKAPTVQVMSDERGPWGRRLRFQLAPGQDAHSLNLAIANDADVRLVRMDGETVQGYPARKHKWFPDHLHYRFVAPPLQGIEVELVVRSADPVSLIVWEVATGVPEVASSLVAARPASAVQSGGGDRTLVSMHTEL